jgi:large subunit ribosomal protein L35
MPKIKTKKGALKRFRKTASGALLRNKAFASHIMSKKSTKRKRNLRKSTLLSKADTKRAARLVPYL